MKIREIVKDALKYPFSNWMKTLILGIIIIISNIPDISKQVISTNIILMAFLSIFGFLIYFLVRGYQFKIIKSSLNGINELPEFNNWCEMFIDGIKVFIVHVVYFIPAILFILIFAAISFTSHPSTVVNVLYAGVLALISQTAGNNAIVMAGIWFVFAILYLLIIVPVLFIAIAYMADNNSELRSAFKFREILNKIRTIGRVNIVKWYLLTGIVIIIISIIGYAVNLILITLIHPIIGNSYKPVVEIIVLSLFVSSYMAIYIYRSVALLFQSSKKQFDNKISNKVIIILIVFLAIFGWIGYGVYQDLSSPTSTGGTFENQMIKFDYPSNLTIRDASTDDNVHIMIYNGTHYLGSIYQDNDVNIEDLYGSGYTKTTINGKAVIIKDATSPVYLFLTSKIALNIELKPNNTVTQNQIMNSLIIKKEFTPLLQQYYGNGISFNYPNDWTLDQPIADDSNNLNDYNVLTTSNHPDSYQLIEVHKYGSNNSPKFSIYIVPNNSTTDQNKMHNSQNKVITNGSRLLMSQNTITVDNKVAYEYQWTTKTNDEFNETMRINQIYLDKNNRTFLITIQAPDNDFANEEPIFNAILNSLQIQ